MARIKLRDIDYAGILESKKQHFIAAGFEVDHERLNPHLFGFQRAVVGWALRKGRAAIFAGTGLGKSLMQLSWAFEVASHTGGNVLIAAPLAVSRQTVQEAEKFGILVKYVAEPEQINPHMAGVYITNYERLERFDVPLAGIVLDESSILKSFLGRISQMILDKFKHVPYKLCATATPSPNDFIELGTTSEFLGILKRDEMMAQYFINDQLGKRGDRAEKAGKHKAGKTGWRIKGHSEKEFYKWISTWAMFISHPEDLGFDDQGYDLPPLNVHRVILDSEPTEGSLFVQRAKSLTERREARKESLPERAMETVEIINRHPDDQWLVWVNYNEEGDKMKKLLKHSVEVSGADDPEDKASAFLDFANGTLSTLITKPKIAGFGMNWQSCHRMVFMGISDSFEQYYQAIRRCYRFGQENPVEVYIVLSEKEMEILDNIEYKQAQHDRMVANMRAVMKDLTRAELENVKYEKPDYVPQKRMVFAL